MDRSSGRVQTVKITASETAKNGVDTAYGLCRTYTCRPSAAIVPNSYGVIAMAPGSLPTLIALPALFVAVLIGVTVPDRALVT